MKAAKSQLRTLALLLMLPLVYVGVSALSSQTFISLIAHGPIQQGHKEIDCEACHTPGEGSLRQQVQANVFYALGMRDNPVDFGYKKVASEQCLDCHARPNDRHPIYRFNEPRFTEARLKLGANSCLGCHGEHADERVALGGEFCSNCHEDLALKSDPLDVAHTELVANSAWESCLGCHDFHGNHSHTPQTVVKDAFASAQIQAYLKQGVDPYGLPKIFEAKK